MSDSDRYNLPPLPEKTSAVLKGVPMAGQAEKLVRVRREITHAEDMTRAEQIEHEAKQRADAMLEKASVEAGQLVSSAKQEADNIRKNARNDGDLTAKREALEKLAGLIAQLEKEINGLREVRAGFLNKNIEGIVDFSCTLAERILVTELSTRPDAIADRARRLLERMPPGVNVTISTSSDDIEVIERYLQQAGGPSDVLHASLRTDPTLEPGCLRLECDSGKIDAGLLDVLQEVGNLLREQARHFSASEVPCVTEGEGG